MKRRQIVKWTTCLIAAVSAYTPGLEAKNAKKTKQSAVAQVSTEHLQLLSDASESFGPSAKMKAHVEKTTTLALLKKKKTSQGELTLQSGNMRLELEGQEKTLVVVNGGEAWVVTYPPAEFKGSPRQVIKASLKSKSKQKLGLAALLTGSGLTQIFKIDKSQDNDTFVRYDLIPIKASSDFKRAQVEVLKASQQIQAISYWDDLDNESRFDFSDIKKNPKVSSSAFKFTPSSKDEVTVIE